MLYIVSIIRDYMEYYGLYGMLWAILCINDGGGPHDNPHHDPVHFFCGWSRASWGKESPA